MDNLDKNLDDAFQEIAHLIRSDEHKQLLAEFTTAEVRAIEEDAGPLLDVDKRIVARIIALDFFTEDQKVRDFCIQVLAKITEETAKRNGREIEEQEPNEIAWVGTVLQSNPICKKCGEKMEAFAEMNGMKVFECVECKWVAFGSLAEDIFNRRT